MCYTVIKGFCGVASAILLLSARGARRGLKEEKTKIYPRKAI